MRTDQKKLNIVREQGWNQTMATSRGEESTKQEISKSLYQSGQDDVTVVGSEFRVQKTPMMTKDSYEGIFPQKNAPVQLRNPNYSHNISQINEHSFNKDMDKKLVSQSFNMKTDHSVNQTLRANSVDEKQDSIEYSLLEDSHQTK